MMLAAGVGGVKRQAADAHDAGRGVGRVERQGC